MPSGPVRLALREMRRRLGRFVILAGAVTVLVFFLLFQQGLLSGLVTEFVGALRNQDADVLVYSQEARDNVQASVVAAETVDAVARVDGVAEAGPLGVATFTVDAGGERTDATVFGHRLGGPGAPTGPVEGRRPDGPGEAVAPSGAGEGFGLGDVVTVVPGGSEIEIVGLADQLKLSVTPTLFVDYATYAEARLAQNPDAQRVPPSAVAVWTAEDADDETVVERITAEVVGADALTRARAVDQAPGVSSVQQSFFIILVLGYVTVTIVVGFFFLIITTQKLDQLTLLKALGVPSARVSGIVLGQVAAVLVVALVVGGGLALWALASGSSGISAGLDLASLATSAVLLTVLAMVAVAASLVRIARLDPAAAVDQGGLG